MNKSFKLFLSSFLVLLLCASLTLGVFATDEGGGDGSGDETTTSTTESTEASTTETTTSPTTETTTAPTETTTAPTSEPTTEPTTAPTTTPKPSVTKDPTDEIITVDGRAVFIARADNAADMEWFVIAPNGTAYTIVEAKNQFPGLKVTGEDTEKLVFEQVPLSMDGCKIHAVFTNVSGTVDSKSARLTVRKAELVPPYIKSQPKSATAQLNEPVTLSVTVDDPNQGTTLKYQWYSASSPSTASGSIVGGGNSATYTPSTQYKGTTYYFVKVWAESADQTSAKTTSQVASVAVADPNATEPTTAPTTAPTTVPAETETVPETTLPPAPQPQKKGGNGVLFVVLFMLLLIAFGATATAIYLIRKDGMGNDDDEYDDEPELPFPKLNLPKLPKMEFVEKKEEHKFVAHEDRPTAVVPPIPPASPRAAGWICQCGSRNRGSYCQDCGNLKPDYAVQYACDHCGWEAPDPQHPPKQCPQCGEMFNIQDIDF